MKVVSRYRKVGACLCVLAALAVAATVLASCGSSGGGAQSTGTATKLPPGVTEQETTTESTTPTTTETSAPESSGTGTAGTSPSSTEQATSTTPKNAADLVGGRFTAVSATRPDSNKSVLSSGGREVKGDYLEVEFTIMNASTDHLVDLSEYSFRLTSPGIDADAYEDYYGTTTTYGGYADENEISAALLSYEDLQAVTYKLKELENIDKVFVFFDLNPVSTEKNAGVTKDNTSLVIRKTSGTDYGEEVTIPLAGYPDS